MSCELQRKKTKGGPVAKIKLDGPVYIYRWQLYIS